MIARSEQSGSSRCGPGGGQHDHPLLVLQRAAGNQAVTALVQRKAKGFHSSRVAIGSIDSIYDGKCDAVMQSAAVRQKWSRGLLAKDVSIIFDCGPKSFEFSSSHPHVGDRFPWYLNGGDAFVTTAVAKGLDDIEDDMDDAGPQFWSGYHAVQGRLAADLKEYRWIAQ